MNMQDLRLAQKLMAELDTEALKQDPRKAINDLKAKGLNFIEIPEGADITIIENTKYTMYFVMPVYDAVIFDEATLGNIDAAGSASSALCASSASTMSTFCGTFSSASSALSASTTGSLG